MNILEVRNLSKKFKNKIIVKDINLSIEEGEIFGLVGPNGAGKTTIIKLILGLYNLDTGSISISGFDLKDNFEECMESVGAIIENPEMYGYLSGRKNLEIYARMHKNVSKGDVEKIIEFVKLKDRINNRVKTYSLGMKQRLGLAQAILSNPKLLILDEPTNGLDPLGIKELRELLKALAKEMGTAVFISSHILSEIELVCDKVAIIDNGEILEIKEVNKNANDDLYLIETDDTEKIENISIENFEYKIIDRGIIIRTSKKKLADVSKFLVEHNISIYGISKYKKSLEDEFMDKISKGQIR